MFIRILNTWTICVLLLVVIPTFSLPIVEVKPKTLYDAVITKCPNLEKTTLKDNEIFSKKCLNWSEINATNSFSENTRENVRCLVLYNALVSFCTEMGDNLLRVKGIIPSPSTALTYTPETICNSKNIYSLNKTEHNTSNLIQNSNDCLLLCADFTASRVSDICNFAYYFGTFNVSKFSHKLDTLHEDHNIHEHDPVEPAKNKPDNSHAPDISPNITKPSNEPHDAAPVGEIKSADEAQVVPPVGQDKEPVNIPGVAIAHKVPETDKKHQDSEAAQAEISKKGPEPEVKPDREPNQSETEGKPAKPPLLEKVISASNSPSGKEDSIAGHLNEGSLPKQETKENANAENSKPVTTQEKDKKPEIANDKPQQDPAENPGLDLEDNSQGANDEDLDQNDLENENGGVEQEDAKPEPAMPESPSEPKTSSKKVVKPSTVEDEAVNNFNTPEDDMDGDSYFFSYFTVIMCLFIVGYVGYHNRQKVLALILEGKKGRRAGRGRRPNSANYHKLDTNLEEAISSSCTKNASNVIY